MIKSVTKWSELDTSEVELHECELDGCKLYGFQMSGFKFKDGTPLPPLCSVERDTWEEEIMGNFDSETYELAYELIDWSGGDYEQEALRC